MEEAINARNLSVYYGSISCPERGGPENRQRGLSWNHRPKRRRQKHIAESLLGLIKPDKGEVRIFGKETFKARNT